VSAARRAGGAGFMLIELMVALSVLVVGAMAIAASFGGSRRLIATYERQQSVAQRAQQEIERIQALPYAQIALTGTPPTSSDPANPDSNVAAGPPATYSSDGTAAARETLVVDAGAGQLSPGPRAWSDRRLSGSLYDFVTWHTDPGCGSGCPASANYKRVTVAVTVTVAGGGGPTRPVVVSTYVTDPNAAPAGSVSNGNLNPLADPSTTCQNTQGQAVSCTSGIGSGNATSWFLYDTPATQAAWQPIAASHATHPTIAPFGVCTALSTAGCPQPDLMDTPPTPASSPLQPLFTYSTDQPGSYPGGRVLRRDAGTGCAGLLSTTDNAKGAMWVTPPLGTGTTLSGTGGMTLFSQTLHGVPAPVTLCVRLYAVPGSIANLVALPPVALGAAVPIPLQAWPGALEPISFTFSYSPTTLTLLSGARIGVRLWIDQSSSDDLVVVYDHPSAKSVLQLNSQ